MRKIEKSPVWRGIEKQNNNKSLDVKIWRENEEFRQVAIVYYANNRKRLVPVEYCELA